MRRVKTTLELQILDNCNLRCDYCCNDDYPGKKGSLEASVVKDLITTQGIEKITFTGGEPTLRWEDLLDFIASARQNGKTTQTNTNCLLLDERRTEALEKAGLDIAYISFEGSTPQTFGSIRTPGISESKSQVMYGKMLENLKVIADSNITLECDYTITRANLGELHAVHSLLQSIGADRLNVRNVLMSGRATKVLRASDEYVVRELRGLSEVLTTGESLAVTIGSMDFDDPLKFSPVLKSLGLDVSSCQSGRTSFYVRVNGDVYACNNVANSVIGNIHEGSGTPSEKIYAIMSGSQDKRVLTLQESCISSCADTKCGKLLDTGPVKARRLPVAYQ